MRALAERLVTVPGVVAVALGGSRARGTHRPDSDHDLGLYYRGTLDVDALQALATEVADGPVEVTRPGAWGPWVDGGGWLTVEGRPVDWIYRSLDRVEAVWADCAAGRYTVEFQVGHPLGFYSYAYAGEVALCRLLADPAGELAALQRRAYPPALGAALVAGLWEADFAIGNAKKGAAGGDPAYVAGCLFRAVGVLCHALHGHARRWVVNEKGLVASAATLPAAPPGLAARAGDLLGWAGTTPEHLAATVASAATLAGEVRSAVGFVVPPP